MIPFPVRPARVFPVRQRLRLLAGAAALLLAACGGGGSSRPPAETIEDAPYFPLAVGDQRAYCIESVWGSDLGCDPVLDVQCPPRSFDLVVETVEGEVTRAGRIGRTLRSVDQRGATSSAVYWASDDAVAFVTTQGGPPTWQTLFELPPRAGDEYRTFFGRALPTGEDVDRDGIEDTRDVTETVRIEGFRTIDTPAGRFDVLDVNSTWTEDFRYSGGGGEFSRETRRSSYDELLGLVRASSDYVFDVDTIYTDVWLIAYDVGGLRSALPVPAARVQDCVAALDPAAGAAARALAAPRSESPAARVTPRAGQRLPLGPAAPMPRAAR